MTAFEGSSHCIRKFLTAPVNGETYPYAGCWVPDVARDGDIVVLLNGGIFPFVLRPIKNTNQYYWIGAGGFWYYDLRESDNGRGAHRLHPSLKTKQPQLLCRNHLAFSRWLSAVCRNERLYNQLLEQKVEKKHKVFQPLDVSASVWLEHLTRVPRELRNVNHERWISGYRPLKYREAKMHMHIPLRERARYAEPKVAASSLPQQQFVII